MKKFHLHLIFIFFVPILTYAQTLSFGGIYGFTSYHGDVNEHFLFKFRSDRTVAGLFLKYHINRNMGIRVNALDGYLSGSDREFETAWRQKRGFGFKSPIKEFSATFEYDLCQIIRPDKASPISLYAQLGLGYALTKPQVDFNEPNPMMEDVVSDKLAQYNRNIPVIPMGFTLAWHCSSSFSVGVETSFRKTFTDYLDGISKTANPNLKDWYFFGNVSVAYSISNLFADKSGYRIRNRSVRCPVF